jgi:hypothetical protein
MKREAATIRFLRKTWALWVVLALVGLSFLVW